jgi:DNA repair exonuclease SbcCD nuclease subunit
MRIAHFSDTHLGFRAYSRQSESGWNQREEDVLGTFDRVLASIADWDPDVVLHTGDFFDVVKPSNHTIVAASERLSSFQRKRGYRPFVIVAGNHETPKSHDAGCILRLFGTAAGGGLVEGVFVAIDEACSLPLPGVEVFAVPTRGLGARAGGAFRPSGKEKRNVLAAHGLDASLGLSHSDFALSEFNPDDWDYVALGDYHIRKRIGENAAYSGSTDYTSSNLWEEIGIEKGWFLVDLDSKHFEFVPVKPIRTAIDLPVIDAKGLTGKEIGDALEARSEEIMAEFPIVRQRLWNVHPAVRADIPSSTLRAIRLRCTHYRLDIQIEAAEGSHLPRGGGSLEAEWSEFVSRRELPAGIDRDALVSAGTKLLMEVQDDPEAPLD